MAVVLLYKVYRFTYWSPARPIRDIRIETFGLDKDLDYRKMVVGYGPMDRETIIRVA